MNNSNYTRFRIEQLHDFAKSTTYDAESELFSPKFRILDRNSQKGTLTPTTDVKIPNIFPSLVFFTKNYERVCSPHGTDDENEALMVPLYMKLLLYTL